MVRSRKVYMHSPYTLYTNYYIMGNGHMSVCIRVLHGEMEVLQLICVILPSRLAVDLFKSNTH